MATNYDVLVQVCLANAYAIEADEATKGNVKMILIAAAKYRLMWARYARSVDIIEAG